MNETYNPDKVYRTSYALALTFGLNDVMSGTFASKMSTDHPTWYDSKGDMIIDMLKQFLQERFKQVFS